MTDLPGQVVEEILKRVDIPDSLAELIYWLMVREVETGYKALNLNEYSPPVTDALVPYTIAILSVLQKLPNLEGNTFRAPLHELAGVDIAHLHSLSKLTPHGFRKHAESELPTGVKNFTGNHVDRFAHGMWKDLLSYQLSFDVPKVRRFEHTHILAPSGAGKTTLLQHLITQDVQTTDTVIVMTLKGELLPSIARLKCIDPERLVFIRPQDRPLALNVFDIKGDTNNVVSLLNYVFASILETAISPKQSTLLNYCIRLLLLAPGSSLLTLRTLMKSEALPEYLHPYLKNLSPAGQEFFRDQFGHKKQYGETKENLVWRLDMLLENDIIAGMFSQPRNLFSMSDIFESGKVLLIDTNVKTLGEMGSAFLGRFFISLVQLASQQRDTSKKLRPVWFYIDEASSYFTNTIESLLERAREARVGLTIAHQQLSQFKDPGLEDSVHSNTGIKYVGKLQAKDAYRMGTELQVDKHVLMNQPQYTFRLSVRGLLPPISVRAGTEPQPVRSVKELERVIEASAERYSTGIQQQPEDDHSEPEDDDDIERYNKA